MNKTIKHRAIFISDLHLGSVYGQPKKVEEFLKQVECDYLYLVGDIIDFWALDRNMSGKFNQDCLNVVRAILTKVKRGTQVFYIPGNHDQFVRDSLLHNSPNAHEWIGGIAITNELTHTTLSKRHYKVIHGDQFDNKVANVRWLNRFGDVGYSLLLYLNKPVQRIRQWLGLTSHWSLSQAIKKQVKEAILFTEKYHYMAMAYGRAYSLDGIICGHIHSAEIIKEADGFTYCNCGDWVESFTYLYEDEHGTIQKAEFKGK